MRVTPDRVSMTHGEFRNLFGVAPGQTPMRPALVAAAPAPADAPADAPAQDAPASTGRKPRYSCDKHADHGTYSANGIASHRAWCAGNVTQS